MTDIIPILKEREKSLIHKISISETKIDDNLIPTIKINMTVNLEAMQDISALANEEHLALTLGKSILKTKNTKNEQKYICNKAKECQDEGCPHHKPHYKEIDKEYKCTDWEDCLSINENKKVRCIKATEHICKYCNGKGESWKEDEFGGWEKCKKCEGTGKDE